MATKRERPTDFFNDSEDEDLEYLIEASIENQNDKKNDVVGLDEYLNQKSSNEKPCSYVLPTNPFADSVDDFAQFDSNAFDEENLFDIPVYPSSPPDASVTAAMDFMDISDEKEIEIDLTEKLPDVESYNIPEEAERFVDYTEVPRTGAFVSATCPTTGTSLFFSKKTPAELKRRQKTLNDLAIKKSRRSLLSKPLWQLRKEIEKNNQEELKKIEKEIEESRRKKKKVQPKDDSGQLWVDKYRPTSYMDLMGDQRVNRDVLRWVKQWDYCVFKKSVKKESQRDKQLKHYKSTFGAEPKFAAFKKDIKETNDPLLRPEKKILLMSGPPGFGKTTLAHVIAKQAGYNIIEVNASDDRTGEVVKSKIKASLEHQAIIRDVNIKEEKREMSMTSKPNLLIIDEIDGASSGGGQDSFIKQLVQIATAEITDEKKGKQKGPKPLLRPIICICNDAYAPVLRPLRMVAQQVQFRKVPMMTLAKRLQSICDNEGLESDLRTLSLLSETTDGDLRSCLNTLQFVRGKSAVLTRDMLKEAGLGQKDMGQSVFSVWEDLFAAPNARLKNSMNKDDFDNNKYMDRLTTAVMSNGEVERIMQGCFEAYPMMRFHDVALEKFCFIGEWLHFYDQLNYRVNERHEYDMFKYLPYPIVNFHRYFAGAAVQEHRVEYPRVDYEVYSTKKSYENLIEVFMAGIHPQKRRFLNREMIASELVPLLMHVISPELKPMNQQLVKPAEKAKLDRLVHIMIEFGLSFVHEKNEEGQYVFKLEPPVEQLLNYKLSAPKSILPKQYAVRQMIAHEIETEILRRREEASQARNKGNKKKPEALPTPEKIKQEISADRQVALDFFGRAIVPRAETDRPLKNLKMEGKAA
ncbi:hypothetical protein HMPREF1544_00154 [Mucor circinelloides 1006PhL]|uniref:AAA+ ATPase domain-containing protein n=1 Tax=Mucor circinelloides f. circinelloides (strain 1006PhL) TaxID=1220926 RepID=S2KKZ3_MUCC1|nr:hypothetical protein HMPREF1544_00154 [Mucor circinelloides 1006PhL]